MEVTKEYIESLIEHTVDVTIKKLKSNNLIKVEKKSPYKRTEELLRNYNELKKSEEPDTIRIVRRLESVLNDIRSDIYYDIIPLTYFKNETREVIAEKLRTTSTTISRNKNRLINKISLKIFSDDTLKELF